MASGWQVSPPSQRGHRTPAASPAPASRGRRSQGWRDCLPRTRPLKPAPICHDRATSTARVRAALRLRSCYASGQRGRATRGCACAEGARPLAAEVAFGLSRSGAVGRRTSRAGSRSCVATSATFTQARRDAGGSLLQLETCDRLGRAQRARARAALLEGFPKSPRFSRAQAAFPDRSGPHGMTV